MRIPVLAGREIDQRDQPGSPPVAVINQVFAKANFGEQNPLGNVFRFDGRNHLRNWRSWARSEAAWSG